MTDGALMLYFTQPIFNRLTHSATSSANNLDSCASDWVKNCSPAGASPDLNAFPQCL